MTTVGDTFKQVRETEGRAAVRRVLAGHLRLRYLSRDSADAVAKVRAPDGSPVDEDVIESEARILEQEAQEMEKSVKALRAVEVSDD